MSTLREQAEMAARDVVCACSASTRNGPCDTCIADAIERVAKAFAEQVAVRVAIMSFDKLVIREEDDFAPGPISREALAAAERGEGVSKRNDDRLTGRRQPK